MPPLPKDDGELLDRRSANDARRAPSTTLPAGGYDGPHPSPPASLGAGLVDAVLELWRSPMAAAWVVEDGDLVVELVRTRALVDATLAAGKFPPGTATARVGILEDRLGLTPKSRAAMRWRIVDDPVDGVNRYSRSADHGAATFSAEVADKLRGMGVEVVDDGA